MLSDLKPAHIRKIIQLSKAARKEQSTGNAKSSISAAALRAYIETLPTVARAELFALARVGKQELRPEDFSQGVAAAAQLSDESLVRTLAESPTLAEDLRRAPHGETPWRAKGVTSESGQALTKSVVTRRAIAAALLANTSGAVFILSIASGRSAFAGFIVPLQALLCTVLSGILFARGYERLPGPPILRGVIFSMLLWLFEMVVLLPIAEAGFFGAKFGAAVLALTLPSLIVYGAILGRTFSYFCRHRRSGLRFWGVAVGLLCLYLIARTFVAQPFNITGGADKPTILPGDYILASKFAYGYSRYSFPLSPPLFSGRLFSSPPQRGDLVNFRHPKNPSNDWISRIVGLPGDRIQMVAGRLYVNGTAVSLQAMPDYVEAGQRPVKRWQETILGGATYYTLDLVDNGFADNTQTYLVPDGHYFVMGDNRDNSTDSRFLSQLGYVPFENIVGKAAFIFFSVQEGERAWQFWRWPSTVRWERVFTLIR